MINKREFIAGATLSLFSSGDEAQSTGFERRLPNDEEPHRCEFVRLRYPGIESNAVAVDLIAILSENVRIPISIGFFHLQRDLQTDDQYRNEAIAKAQAFLTFVGGMHVEISTRRRR